MRALAMLSMCAICAAAQDAPVEVPVGIALAVRLERSVKAAHARPGDKVQATLLSSVLSHGQVIVPRSAKVFGSVLVAVPHQGATASRLMIHFERAEWAHSGAPLNAYVVRNIRVKRTFEFNGSHSPCRDVGSGFRQHTKGVDPRFQVPMRPDNPCEMQQSTSPTQRDPVTFVTPPMKDVILERAETPVGATVFVSPKKNISLDRGIILEIRTVAP